MQGKKPPPWMDYVPRRRTAACKFCQLVCIDIAEHRKNLPSRRAGRTILASINAPAAFATVFTRNSQTLSTVIQKQSVCFLIGESK
jgi:hypothetical protein